MQNLTSQKDNELEKLKLRYETMIRELEEQLKKERENMEGSS